jgi:hypothetical protein
LVSRLIAREAGAASDSNAAAMAANVIQRITADLCHFLGSDGCDALLMRARSQAQAAHPSLKNITIVALPDPSVQGVPESIQAHGVAETAAGLESTLVSLIELLGRLIGDELAMKIVDQDRAEGGLPDGPRGRNEP